MARKNTITHIQTRPIALMITTSTTQNKTKRNRLLRILLLFITCLMVWGKATWSQTSTINPDTVCINTTEPYLVDANPGSKYVWSTYYGTGTITYPYDSAPNITVTWNNSLLTDTLYVTEFNTYGCSGTPNKLIINKFSVPGVTLNSSTFNICEGTTLQITANATGLSPYTYQWFHNGNPIPGANSAILSIPNVNATHGGSYTCQVSNACGATLSSAANVTILFNPVITLQPTPKSTCPGNNIQLSVANTGSTPLTYQWYFKENPLTNNPPHITGANTSTLSITGMTYADTGLYQVMISNSCATVSSNAVRVTINVPPVITNPPQSLSICDGQNAVFSVEATGDSLYYQWKKNGLDLSGQTNPTLTFLPAYYPDTGNYSVRVYNTCGSVTSQMAHLNMNIPPAIVTQPQSVSICNGNNTSFSPVISGDSLVYQWYKYGIPVAGATSATLSFTPALYTDTGFYYLTAHNNCGWVTTETVQLNMNIPPAITVQPQNISACLTQTVTFTVSTTGDSLKYQWLKNGVNIPGATNSSLTLSNIQYADTASYVCRVWNNCGEVYSQPGVLNINILPVITKQPVKYSACLGGTASFSVTATGDSLKYQWKLNGSDVAGATSPTLIIDPVTPASLGNYTCLVYNNCGSELSLSAALTVNIAPQITIQPKKISSCPGYSATFSVTATGDSLKYQWRKNGVNIPGATNSSLTINPVTYADTARYSVRVYNTCGQEISQNARLSINIPPVITLNPKNYSTCIGSSFTLSGAATGDSLNYQWEFRNALNPIWTNVPGATNPVYTKTNVQYADTGTYRLKVYNTCGTAYTTTARVNVNIVPVITQHPKKVSTCPGQTVQFSVSATGDSLKYQWYKNGFAMSGATNNTLVISPVTYSDTAKYTVMVYNTCGTQMSNSAKLHINVPPVITQQPSNLLTCVGDFNVMTVVVSGDSLFYQWYFNGNPLAGATNSALVFNPVTLDDIGAYHVYIHNTCGDATSQTVNLFANIDPTVIEDPQSVLTCLGNTETLEVGILALGSALPDFQWFKDGNILPGKTSNILVLNNITVSDTGDYYCQLSNNCDLVYTDIAHVSVDLAPQIIQQPMNISTCIGNAESFQVIATGTRLKFQWYKDGSPLPGATSNTLSFNPVQASHMGTYYCKIWNHCGTVNTQPVVLYMNVPPAITLQPNNQKACAGDNVILQVAATGDFLQYQWFKDGNPLPGATSAVLQFNPVNYTHRGLYQCRVQNNCGTAWSNAVWVWVNTTPIITVQPKGISTCEGNSYTLSVTALGDSISYQWQLEGIDIPGATSNTYTLTNIQYSQTGNYTCYLTTRCGSVMTQQAKVSVNRVPIITQQPSNVNACEGDFVSIDFGITGDSLYYQWYKDGVVIAGAVQPSLQFPAITIADRGIYRCHIWNTCGEAWTINVNVWVNILPGVATQPVSQTRCENDSVSFRITPVGDNITLQWYHNNQPIPGATSNIYEIPVVAFADAGQYFCRVTSASCGFYDSDIITLNVIQKFAVNALISNITCNGNNNGAIDLTLAGATAPVTYRWSNGATTEDLNNLAPGFYSVYIRDANNCREKKTFEIGEPDVLAFVHDTTTFSNVLRQGGPGNDMILDIKTDRYGNTYVTGKFQGTASFQTQNLTSYGGDDIFLAKYNNAGNLSWIRQAGGSLNDVGRSLTLDSLGNIYLTGSFEVMAWFGSTQITANGGSDIFVAKYNNNGTLQWVKNFGGFFDDHGNAIASTEGGYTWVAGSIQGITSFGNNPVISNGGDDAFILKLNPEGNVQWVKNAGGTSEDMAYGLALDVAEDATIVGRFQSTASFGTTVLTSSGNNDIFIAKYSPIGNLKWARRAGGTGNDLARAARTDYSQNIYLVGSFEGNATFGTLNMTSNGLKDAFVAKYDKGGNPLWIRKIGGSDIDNAKALDVDALSNVYVAGAFRHNMTLGDKTLTSAGMSDIFIVKYNAAGYRVWSQQAGGPAADSAMAIALRPDKNLALGGSFGATATFGSTTLISQGMDDSFLARVNQVAVPTPPVVQNALCFGGNQGSINLTVGGGTLPYNYLWSTGATTEDLINLQAGTYWVFIKDANLCELNSQFTITNQFPFPTPPVAATVNRDYFCTTDPGNIVLTATGGSGDYIAWYTSSCGGTLVGTGNPLTIPSPDITTTYFARWENACGASTCAQVTVHVIDLPVAPTLATATPNPICQGTAYITLSATGGQGEILKWYANGCGVQQVGTGTPLTIPAPVVPTTYFARWESACGASSCASVTVDVTPLPQPVTSVTASVNPICFNHTDPITLTATGGSGDVLKWSANTCGGQVIGMGNSILIDPPTVTTTYYAFWENSCGISICDSVTIVVIPNPQPPTSILTSNNFFCAGTLPTITLSAIGGNGETLRWFTGYCGSTNIVGTGTTITIPAPTTTTVYYARWENSCGVSPCAFQTVTVYPQPTVFFSGLDPDYCVNGNNVLLTGNQAPNGYFSGPGIVNNGNGTAWFSPSMAGVGGPYQITYTFTNSNGCTQSQTQTTTVHDIPFVNFVGLANSYCINATPVSLTGNHAPQGYFSGPGITSSINGIGIFDPSVAGVGTHQISYTYTDNWGCENTATKTVTVIALPVVDFAGLLSAYCINANPVTLTGNHAPQGFFSGLGVTNIGLGQAIFDPQAAGVGGPYPVTYTYSDPNGCSNSKTKFVTVNPLPVASFSGLMPEYCLNEDQDTLVGNMVPLGTFSGPGITNNNNGTAFFNPAAAGPGGPYTITYSYTDGNGCSASETQTTIVRPLPTVFFTGLNPMYCVNANPVNLVGNKAPFGTFSGPGITDNGNGTATFDPATAGVGTHQITYSYTDNSGCTNSQTKTVVINPLPNVYFTGLAPSYCANSPFALLTGSQVPYGTFTGPGILDLGNGKARFYPNQAGVGGPYVITYTYIDNNACTGTFSDTTEVLPLPQLSVSGIDPVYCVNAAPDTLTGNMAPLGTFSGPGITDLLIGKALFNPTAAGVGGPYTITYAYTDPTAGCSNTVSYQVNVAPLPQVSFNTLAAGYCLNNGPVILSGSHKPYGAFTGTGVTDYGNGTGIFNPSAAGVGGPYQITYTYTDPNGCSGSQTQSTSVYPLPVAPDSIVASANNFCTGSIPNITLYAIGGSGNVVKWYTGGCGGTLIGQGQNIVIPSPADTTIYYARWENQCGASECASIQINIIHYPVSPQLVMSSHNNFCSQSVDSITLTGIGGSGQVFKWFSGSCGGTLVGTGTPLKIAAPLTTTTYYGRWETGCGPSACQSVTVNVFPLTTPPDSLTVNHNNFCQGTVPNITLKAWGGSGDFVEWYADECGTIPIGNQQQITIPAPDTTTTYFARWINNCDSSICQSITVQVNPQALPPDTITLDNNNFCAGTVGIVTLTASGGTGNYIEWFEGSCGGTVVSNNNPLLINAPTQTTTYYARWVNDCGPSACTPVTITVKPQPVKPDSLTVDTNYFCQAYNGIIILRGFGGLGDTLQWFANSCNGDYIGKGTELRIPAPDTTTWYFARWINTCGESVCDSIKVVVDEPLPLDSVWVDRPIVCFDDPGKVKLFASGGYGTTIHWFANSCGGNSIGTGSLLQINSPTVTTKYFARWENHCGVTACDTVEVLVIPQAQPPLLITVDTNYFCPNTVSSITLTAFGGYGDTLSGYGDTLRWFANSCGGLEIGTGTSITIPAPVKTTTYYARWENHCSTSECLAFTVVVDVPKPVTAVWADTNNFCKGAVEDITLMAYGGYGEFLRWYAFDGTNYNLLATGQPFNLFAPDTTTTYYVRWENHCGNSAWNSITIKVNTPVAPPVITVDTNGFCSDYGLPITLSAQGGNGDTLRWFTGACGGTVIGVGNPLTIPAPTITTTYYARYENICGISDCNTITVNVVPAPIVFAGGVDSVCEKGVYQISKAMAAHFTNIWWTTSGNGTFDDNTSLMPVYSLGSEDFETRDTVYLTLHAQGLAPCGIYKDSLMLIVNPLPVITFFPADTAICSDSSLMIATAGAATYQWKPTTGLTQVAGDLYKAQPKHTTTYTVIGTSRSGCVDSTTYHLPVYPAPYVNLGQDLYLFTCEPIVLDAGGGDGNWYYEWQDGSRKRTYKVSENGTFWVKVSNDGCARIDTIRVQLCEGYLWAPSAFTPNADGLNEVFKVVTTDETVKFQMYIYSRNGQLVFQTDDITKGWDGRDMKGNMCPGGVYVWKVIYQGKGTKAPGIQYTRSGAVTLLR